MNPRTRLQATKRETPPGSTASSRVAILFEDIRKHSEEIRNMRDLLERKADHDALVRLEKRVTLLEQQMGL